MKILLIIALFSFISCKDKSIESNISNTNNTSIPGWHLFSQSFGPDQCNIFPECTHRWGCAFLINRDYNFKICEEDTSGVIIDRDYDCRSFNSDFCSNRYINGNAYCNSTDGKCYPNPILCEEDSQCPMYFFCLDGKCVEPLRTYAGFGAGATDSCVKPLECDFDSECFYWEICQHNPSYPEEKGQCRSKYCDFDSSKNYFWNQCGMSSYCAEGTSYGLLIPMDDPNWPTMPDQIWEHPGDCVETTLCDTNQDCTNPDMPVCDQIRKLCIPTDYPQ